MRDPRLLSSASSGTGLASASSVPTSKVTYLKGNPYGEIYRERREIIEDRRARGKNVSDRMIMDRNMDVFLGLYHAGEKVHRTFPDGMPLDWELQQARDLFIKWEDTYKKAQVDSRKNPDPDSSVRQELYKINVEAALAEALGLTPKEAGFACSRG